MGLSLSDILLRDVNAERSDSVMLHVGTQGLVHVPKSDNIIAHFVLEGEIAIEAAGDPDATFVRKGEFALIFYGTKHTIYAATRRPSGQGTTISDWPVGDQPTKLHVGGGKEKARLLSAALRLIHNPTLAHDQNPLSDVIRLGHGAEQIFKYGVLALDVTAIEQAAQGPGAGAFINALMNLHLTHAIRCGGMQLDSAFKELTQSPYMMSSEKARAVATAVRLLETHLDRAWTVEGLAREFGLSRSAFAAVFSECVGMGPMGYLNKVRMERAAALLAEQRLDLPLVAIANWVGYDGPSAFARAFKNHFGVSPRAYCKRAEFEPVAA